MSWCPRRTISALRRLIIWQGFPENGRMANRLQKPLRSMQIMSRGFSMDKLPFWPFSTYAHSIGADRLQLVFEACDMTRGANVESEINMYIQLLHA
jgi:hypothetical protein